MVGPDGVDGAPTSGVTVMDIDSAGEEKQPFFATTLTVAAPVKEELQLTEPDVAEPAIVPAEDGLIDHV